jgi:hypothetical protein
METELVITGASIIVAIIGAGIGYIKNKKLTAVASAASPYLEGMIAYDSAMKDGVCTPEEDAQILQLSKEHYRLLKEVF